MTAGDKRRHGVLRDTSTHAQPRHLARPTKHSGASPTPASRQPSAGTLQERATPQDAGYAAGLETGRAAGLQQGLEAAQQRIDDAMRTARHEFEQMAGQRLQEFKAEANARLAQLERVLDGVDQAVAKRLVELESDAVALAYAAVCQLLGEQAGDVTTIARIVTQGMSQLRGSVLLTVRMNEADLRALLADDQGRRLQAAAPQVKWLADAAVTSGGCLFDTTAGSLDARLETQLVALRAIWAAPAGSGSESR
ncbi:MAG: FliH/SctL family protein [Betaproteobacteria bacterium]